MTTLRFRKPARLACLTVFASTATLLLADASSASSKLPGTISFGHAAHMCGSSGGQFHVSTDGGYSCSYKEGTIDCDGKGNCSTHCQGCSDAVRRRLNGALGGPPASAGTASSAAGSTGTKRRLPVNSVGAVKLTGGSNSSAGANRSGGQSGGRSRH